MCTTYSTARRRFSVLLRVFSISDSLSDSTAHCSWALAAVCRSAASKLEISAECSRSDAKVDWRSAFSAFSCSASRPSASTAETHKADSITESHYSVVWQYYCINHENNNNNNNNNNNDNIYSAVIYGANHMRDFNVVPLGRNRSAPGGRQLVGQAANLTFESACRLL